MFTLPFLFLLLSFSKVTHADAQAEDRDHNGIIVVDEEYLSEEKMKELRIEMVKFQILSQLNFGEAPPSSQRPSETSRQMIEILRKEEEERQVKYDLLNNEYPMTIEAVNISMRCLHSNDSSCKMFLYELNPTFNTSVMSIWIYKTTECSRWISVSPYLTSASEEEYYEWFYYEVGQVGWNKLSLPRFLIPSSWNETISYYVEIVGQNIKDYGDYRPKLMVQRSSFMPPRQRRDVTCDITETCCFKPLKVNFTEIGFNWIVYPEVIDVNMCLGHCRMDHAALRNHYERVLAQVVEKNNSLPASLSQCLKLCCNPKTTKDQRIMFLDADNKSLDSRIPGLIVESCGCS